MLKRIKHPHNLVLEYEIKKDLNFKNLEFIKMKIFELIDTNSATTENKKNYLELFFKIISVENNDISNYDIAKNNNQEFAQAIYPIINKKNDEFISQAIKIDNSILLNKFIYLERVVAHGDFSYLSMPAAIAKSFQTLSNGYLDSEWIAFMYEKNTFYFEEKKIPEDEVKIYLKDLNFFKLPKSASGIKKENNVLLIVGGNTLNNDIYFEPKLERTLRIQF